MAATLSAAKTPAPNVIQPIANVEALIFIKPDVKNQNIIVGDFTYFADKDFEQHEFRWQKRGKRGKVEVYASNLPRGPSSLLRFLLENGEVVFSVNCRYILPIAVHNPFNISIRYPILQYPILTILRNKQIRS